MIFTYFVFTMAVIGLFFTIFFGYIIKSDKKNNTTNNKNSNNKVKI